ncbi:HAD family hydrolase [Candidatus Woesearchaeota archaeon]|nr:HAD family hydrolase [Candidatus Woesearchaeota archaeon]
MISGIIFDLDGVIIDTKAIMVEAFTKSYVSITGKNNPPVEKFLSMNGHCLKGILNELGLPEEMYGLFRKISIEKSQEVTLLPGIKMLLEKMKNLKSRMYILTGKEFDRTDQILTHLKINDYFDFVIGGDMLSKSKPDPEGILRIATQFNHRPHQLISVGDAPFDILASKNANVRCIAAIWADPCSEDQLREYKPDFIATKPIQVLEIIDKINSRSA